MMKKQSGLWKLLAFLTPTVLMIILYAAKGIAPFGSRSFLTGDLYHQYMPFLSEFVHRIRGGEGMDFSYNLGIGSNYLALYAYYLASPFHYLALLLPEKFLIDFIAYLIAVKTGLCGLTACKYLEEHFETQNVGVFLFSMFYAFSGFMAAYNYNIMWVDCVWLLPLILLGVERLVKEGRIGLYCLALGVSIYTNYYLSIMICIFLVLYFAYLFLTCSGNRMRSIGLFAVCSLIAGALASVLLIPEVCAILQTDFGDMDFPTKVESYFSVLDVLARHGINTASERGLDHWPNIYCGCAVMMLLPMYVTNRKISIREKFGKLAIAGFMLLSFSTNILDFLWHGCNYPDSLPARQSFLYCFLVITMCFEAYLKMEQEDKQQILYGYLAAVVFLMYCQKFVDDDAFAYGVKLLTLGFVTGYAILFYLYRTRKNFYVRVGIGALACSLVIAECAVNTINTSLSTTSRTNYLAKEADYKALYEKTKEFGKSFYRVEKFTRKTKNDGTLTGYPTASIFSSTLNSQVMDLFTRLGMRHSKVFYGYDGATMLTAAMLNVDYMFAESSGYENSLYRLLEQSGDVFLYESEKTLPFGYVAPVGFELPEGYKNQPFALQNKMVEKLEVNGKLFESVKKFSKVKEAEFTADWDGIYYGVVNASGTKKLKYENNDEVVFNDLKIGSIIYLEELRKGDTILLTNGDDKDTTPEFSVEIYRMKVDVLDKVLEKLSAQHMEQVQVTSNTITGQLTLTEAGRLILSVPYEDGWKVLVNGSEMRGEKFGGALMAFDLEAGQYDISMKYKPVGKTAGKVVSLAGIAAFLLMLKVTRKKTNGESESEVEDEV